MHTHVLETERLILRPLTTDDAEAEFVWLSDPVVNRYMPYNLYTNVADVVKWLETAVAAEDELHFGFVRKSDGLLIGAGSIGPKGRHAPDVWEFGYNLRRDAWNQGYATEATRAMIDLAHRTYGIRVFTASHAIANPASGRVMEKCGLHFDHFGEYSRFDGSETFPAKFWKIVMEE
ncbi:MAG: GNAT family N-acetyltransferase [Clostridia bacterium]|nr:GNAT family N-acetyltransferase [Clostridia bacterium]